MSVHTEHGGSAASRWVPCPGSVQKTRGMSQSAGEYAKEGTLAHAAAEDCLRWDLDAQDVVDRGYLYDVSETGGKVDHDERPLPPEFAGHVQEYVDLCRDLPGEHLVEQTYSFEPWVPENQGTADHTAICDPVLTITDLKFGMGVQVFAEYNYQLMLYAIGAIEEHGLFHDLERVVLRISQPRLHHFDEWEISVEELMNTWAPYFHERYKLSLQPDAPLVPGETQCKWCLYASSCPALYEYTLDTLAADFADIETEDDELGIADNAATTRVEQRPITVAEAQDLTLDDVARILDRTSVIENFIKKVQARAHEADEAGHKVPGWKRVPGQSHRKWQDEDEAVDTLKRMRLKKDQIFNQQLRSPAQIEKIVTKRQRKKIDALITKPEGSPKLVPESDSREALKPVSADFEDMEDSQTDDDDDLGL